MSNIGRWLEQQGLGEFSAMFEEERVEFETLPDLTEQDLKELGLPLGSRKKLLRAINDLGEGGSSQTGQGSATIDSQSVGSTSGEAERRQLTVMFCDLVGSTQLSSELDLETYRKVLTTYQDVARMAISRYEGFIARYMGDGLLVYFGYPQAHEDDAERAVRAALDIANEIPRLDVALEASLSVRIGIATGQVVAGDIVGEGASEEHAVLGETPNLAARLQGVAEPNAIVISESTRHLVEGRVELEPLGSQELKGISGRVPVYRAIAVRALASRFEAAHGGELTPLSGRDSEQALLLQRWEQAGSGEGQVVFIEGEPGIGKSRLLQGLREKIVDSTCVVQRYQCSPYYTSTPFYPAINLVERAAGLSRDDDTDEKLDKLSAAVSALLPGDEHAPALVAALLSLPVDRFAPLEMTPQKQRFETIRVLVAQLEALASGGPVLMLFEDAHWCDPSTLELLGSIIDRMQSLRVLMLVTHRPEFSPPWTGYGHTTTYSLNRLGRDAVSTVIDGVTGGKALPHEVMEQILAKTDGVPLFVEELTKTVLESGILTDSGDHWRLDGPLPTLAIPSTLQDSLVSRLDRLAAVKEVAQIGACIGREFGFVLLAAVAPIKGSKLQGALAELVRNELVFRRGDFPDATFIFKHALVQDAAKGTLLPSRLQQVHLQIANSLRELYPELEQNQPELLAYHFTEAGMSPEALDYWLLAGEQAIERSAHLEAIEHLSRGLMLLADKEPGDGDDTRELALQVAIGSAHTMTKGHGAKEVEAAFLRARELCERTGSSEQLSSVLFSLWRVYNTLEDFAAARELSGEIMKLASQQQNATVAVMGHFTHGVIDFFCGSIQSAQEHTRHVIDSYEPESHDAYGLRSGQDPGVSARCYRALSLWLSGCADQAVEHSEDAVRFAMKLEHPHSDGFALVVAASVHQLRGDITAVRGASEAALKLAQEQHFSMWEAWARLMRGWVSCREGDETGIAEIEKAISAWRATGAGVFVPHWLAILGEAMVGPEHYAEGLRVTEEGLDLVESQGQRYAEAELLRVRGLLLANGPKDVPAAERSLMKALGVAQAQGAKGWELRAAVDLAQLWRDSARREEALELLRPIYGSFTEGFQSHDLKRAKSLVEELA